MKRNTLNKLVLAFGLIAFTSCKTQRAILPPAKTIPAATKTPAVNSEIISSLKAKQPVFTTLAIKAKADLKINSNSNDVSMSIRIKNSEGIWVSVTAIAGLEVARAFITPDSIKIMNRMQNEYIRKPFSYIYQFTSKQVDFLAVQGLFTASSFPGTLAESSAVTTVDGQVQVKGELSGLLYKMLFSSNRNLVKNELNDQANGQNLNVNYENFGVIKNQELPQSVNINSTANNKSIALSLKYNNITLDEPVDFPFNVPKRFTVKD